MGTAPQEQPHVLPDTEHMAAGRPRGPAACRSWRDRAWGRTLPPTSSQGCFLLLCNERLRQVAKSPGVLQHSRAAYACWSSGGPGRNNQPYGQGAQSQHTPPSDSLHTHLPSQPTGEIMPQSHGCPGSPHSCSNRTGDSLALEPQLQGRRALHTWFPAEQGSAEGLK